ATACKRLLPKSFEILSISSLYECSQLCTKAALFYIHTCTHSIEEPSYLTATTKNNEIIQLSEQQAIQKLIFTPINTYYLA
ncbi:17214_t:CDS:2, partial [Gigaspora margarita]